MIPRKLVVLLLIAAVGIAAAVSANAQNPNSAQTSGLTKVTSTLTGNTYTWVVTNMSNTSNASWDVLGWSLIPYNVPTMVAYTAPSGWTWKGSGWGQVDVNSSDKYFTPPALGPGQSFTFTYTFDPNGKIINSAPGGLQFLTHVGAVVPGSGNLTGTDKWSGTSVSLSSFSTLDFSLQGGSSNTWYDRSLLGTPTPVPEPASIALTGIGLAWLARRRKRIAA